jgi:hypothetical protein
MAVVQGGLSEQGLECFSTKQKLFDTQEQGQLSTESTNKMGRPDHDQQHCYHQAPAVNQRLLLQL